MFKIKRQLQLLVGEQIPSDFRILGVLAEKLQIFLKHAVFSTIK